MARKRLLDWILVPAWIKLVVMLKPLKQTFLKRTLADQRGQTAVEYILLIVVMAGIVTTLGKQVRDHFLGDDSSCVDPTDQSLVCQVQFRLGVRTGQFERMLLHGAPK
jgi:Flp pilus assembly pilin Flp